MVARGEPESDESGPDLSTIQGRIRAFMEATYKEVITFAVAVGVSQGSIYKWLNGQSQPSAGSIQVLHELGCDARWLTTGIGEMYSDTPKGRQWAKQNGGKVAKVVQGQGTVQKTLPDGFREELEELLRKWA